MHNVLWYVFLGSRGGDTRMRIIDTVLKHPMNANQLKEALTLDYSTIRHSLRVLEKNRLLMAEDGKYGVRYKPTIEFENVRQEYDLLVSCFHHEKNCTRGKWEKILKQQQETKRT